MVESIQTDGALANLLEQMADELRERGAVDAQTWQERFPEHASEIERLVPTLEALVEFSSAVGAPADVDHEESFSEKTLGDYRIVRELGRGGMGIVYEAEQLSLSRRVALKILPTAAVLDPRTLQRFKNEAQAAAALDHPHIVDVYGIGCERCVHYYAMRLIDGCSLAEVIVELRGQESEGRGQESVDRSQATNLKPSFDTRSLALLSTVRTANKSAFFRMVAELGIHVAEGLSHAHEQGVIHRDIKPSNLMLDGQGKVWITDFGLAQIETSPGLTQTGDLLGTLRYMSPEQTLGKRTTIDHRSDIYSLGATLYELLTLEPVFGESERAALLQKIALCEPAPPRTLKPEIPADLETIVLKMLEKGASSRYASARDLAADLRRFVENKPIAARRPSWGQRLSKWSSRNRSLVGAVAVTAMIVTALISGLLGWWSRDSAAQRLVAQRVAEEAWQSSEELRRQQKWPDALGELQRAEAAIAARPVELALREKIQRSHRNAAMVLKLEDIRLATSTVVQGDFDYASADAAYARAFDDYGIAVLGSSPGEATAQVRDSSIRAELAAALTDWAIIRHRLAGDRDALRRRLIVVAREADPDPWRNRLRQAWKRDELVEMAASAPLETLPAATLYLFMEAAMFQRANDERMQEKMRQIQRSHADDFWINYALAEFFSNTEPPQLDEAIRYYSVAIGLRPKAAAAHNNLGTVLLKQGRKAEGVAELRRAVELAPDFSAAKVNLGKVTAATSH
jgi:serine/threonine protein kinase